MMQSKFTFFKAGQGSFYGGRIFNRKTRKEFTVVYDCGTSNFVAGNSQSLNREITFFKSSSEYDSKDIDLLFISHLDYDHVSGVKRLLKEFNVKKIILPYIDKEKRQFFLFSVDENGFEDDDLTLDEYTKLIDNPHQFINENSKGTEVYYIKSEGGKDSKYFSDENEGLNQNEENSDEIYPTGTLLAIADQGIDELKGTTNVFLYENNLQFSFKRNGNSQPTFKKLMMLQ